MIANKTVWAGALVWAIVTWAAWAVFVPDTFSSSTLLIVSAVTGLVGVIVVTTAVNARPTRSIAHVLHDAEEAARHRS